jgi:hypothetical protein
MGQIQLLIQSCDLHDRAIRKTKQRTIEDSIAAASKAKTASITEDHSMLQN